MLARSLEFAATIVVLAAMGTGCQTDNAATTTSSSTPNTGRVALLSPPSAGSGLVGWEAEKIRSLYGTPTFVRRETESELWRYDGQDCALFFILYREGGELRVRHVETYPAQGAMADAACLAGIKRRAAASS